MPDKTVEVDTKGFENNVPQHPPTNYAAADEAGTVAPLSAAVAASAISFWTTARRTRTERRGSGDCRRCDDVPVCIAAGFSPGRKDEKTVV